MAGSLRLLTLLISSQGPWLLLVISWILRLKNALLVVLTAFLKVFQSSSFLDALYFSRDWLHSLFHHFLECFIMLTHLAFFFHTCLTLDAKKLTISSISLELIKLEVLRFLMMFITSLTKVVSSSLFFDIKSLDKYTLSSTIGINTDRGAWYNERHHSGWIELLLSSVDPLWRNMRSMTELDSPTMLEYLVGTGLAGTDNFKLKESVIMIRSLLIDE